ncbi:ATP-binding cassette domain-containing protein [Bradyrhizobium sp. Arg314]
MTRLFKGHGWQLIQVTRRSAGVILRRRWVLLLIVSGAGFVTGAAATTFAELLSLIVNRLGNERSSVSPLSSDMLWGSFEHLPQTASPVAKYLWQSGVAGNVVGALLTCFVLALVIAFVAAVSGRARAVISSEIYRQLRADAFARCFDRAGAVDIALANDRPDYATGNVTLASSINRGADSVSNTYTYLLTCAQQLLALVSAIATSGAKVVVITIACVCIIAVQVIVSQMLARKLKKSRRSLDTSVNELQSRTTELLNAREVLLAFDKADRYKAVLQDLVGSVALLQANTDGVESRYAAIQDLINKWGQLLLLGLIIALAINLPQFITTPDDRGTPLVPVIFAITFYGTLLAPARELISGYDAIRRSEAVVASFVAVLGVKEGSADDGRSDGWIVGCPIILDQVKYTPPGSAKAVLHDFNLTIPANSTTLILGPSGCGKTTLGRLCLGFLKADSGIVNIGGSPLPDWSSRYLLRAMSYAPQLDQILDGTIEENLRLASEAVEFSDAELERVLDMVNLKPGGTGRLRWDAKNLSGGETQRLSAARILLDQAEILVLDEPMAGVDVFTMSDIAPAIEKHWQATRQTVLLISHKLVFAGIASHIVVLGPNGVVEQGSPADLLAQKGVYARLQAEAMRQAGG